LRPTLVAIVVRREQIELASRLLGSVDPQRDRQAGEADGIANRKRTAAFQRDFDRLPHHLHRLIGETHQPEDARPLRAPR
jgi:hypothetical protein